MKLFKVEIPKSKLISMPKEERIFFILFGALLNDLSMFQKLMIFTTNVKISNQLIGEAQNFQALCLAKFQIGVLSEGWQLIQKNYYGSGISSKYDKELSIHAKDSLDHLKRYFSGKDNWICSVRNRFSFHYPSQEEISDTIDNIPSSEVFEIFMSEYYGSCLFSMSNIIVNFSILKSMHEVDLQCAMDKWLQDSKNVTKWFGDFLGECLLLIARKYLGFSHIEVEIPEPSDINKVFLPFFIKVEK